VRVDVLDIAEGRDCGVRKAGRFRVQGNGRVDDAGRTDGSTTRSHPSGVNVVRIEPVADRTPRKSTQGPHHRLSRSSRAACSSALNPLSLRPEGFFSDHLPESQNERLRDLGSRHRRPQRQGTIAPGAYVEILPLFPPFLLENILIYMISFLSQTVRDLGKFLNVPATSASSGVIAGCGAGGTPFALARSSRPSPKANKTTVEACSGQFEGRRFTIAECSNT
jgi:hypothetical protein